MNELNDEYLIMGQEFMRRCYAGESTDELHEWLQNKLNRIGGVPDGKDGLLFWEDTFDFYDSVLAKREEYANTPEYLRKDLTWPWASWNAKIDPLPAGFLAVLSAGDGMGKTLYAETIAEDWARKRNSVVYFHYELSHTVMMDRRYVRHTGMTIRELKAMIDSPKKKRVAEAHARLRSWDGQITYQHSAGWSMERTVNRLKQLKVDGKCDVVIIDYLEKAAPNDTQKKLYGSNLYQREADNVERLKNFAENTETPVLMLAQMNKSNKTGGMDKVDRTGVRGAGEKTEKANLVVLLNREWDEIKKTYSPLVDVRVDKNTLGPTSAFSQFMKPESFQIHDLSG